MKPDEITRRLELVRNAYEVNLYGQLPKSEIDANMEAQNLAIQAVKTLEQIKAAVKGHCKFCKYHAAGLQEPPCCDCFDDNDFWEFRWPLGKDAAT